MKKKFFYIAMVALALTGCSDSLSTIGSSDGNSEITIPADAEAGELLIKFSPEMSDILDQAQLCKTRAGKATRSGLAYRQVRVPDPDSESRSELHQFPYLQTDLRASSQNPYHTASRSAPALHLMLSSFLHLPYHKPPLSSIYVIKTYVRFCFFYYTTLLFEKSTRNSNICSFLFSKCI